ncbi:hypothetical protein D3C86_1516140 [compost metagenome]
MTRRRSAPEVLDHRIAAIIGARLELKTGRVRAIDGDVAAVQAFFLQGVDDEATQGIGTDAAQPRHLEPQTRQPDGDVAVGAGNAFVEMTDLGQLTVLLGDEHRHGFAKRQDIEFRHERAPGGVGRGGQASRRGRW